MYTVTCKLGNRPADFHQKLSHNDENMIITNKIAKNIKFDCEVKAGKFIKFINGFYETNALKEIIQGIVLSGLSKSDFFSNTAFYRETALRIFLI